MGENGQVEIMSERGPAGFARPMGFRARVGAMQDHEIRLTNARPVAEGDKEPTIITDQATIRAVLEFNHFSVEPDPSPTGAWAAAVEIDGEHHDLVAFPTGVKSVRHGRARAGRAEDGRDVSIVDGELVVARNLQERAA